MATASNAKAQIAMVPEVTFGVTPTTPAMVAQKYDSFNITPTREELLDESKSGNRGYGFILQGNETLSGSIDGPLTYGNYDGLLASALFGTWTSDVLKRADVRNSFTFEEASPEVPSYRIFRGVVANGMSIEASTDGLITTSFDLMAKSEEVATATLDASYTAVIANEPFVHCSGTVSEGGTPLADVVSISLSVTQNLNSQHVYGACTVNDLIPGRVDVTGTIVCLFDTQVLYNKFKNATNSSLEFTMVDKAGNELAFLVPKLNYTSAEAPVDSGSESRTVTLQFRGLVDPVTGTDLQITRTPV